MSNTQKIDTMIFRAPLEKLLVSEKKKITTTTDKKSNITVKLVYHLFCSQKATDLKKKKNYVALRNGLNQF